jgi:seryl-tRNA synthetase
MCVHCVVCVLCVVHQPRGSTSQVYSVQNHPLCLVGTSEIPLMGLYADKILNANELPIKLVGYGKYVATTLAPPHLRPKR